MRGLQGAGQGARQVPAHLLFASPPERLLCSGPGALLPARMRPGAGRAGARRPAPPPAAGRARASSSSSSSAAGAAVEEWAIIEDPAGRLGRVTHVGEGEGGAVVVTAEELVPYPAGGAGWWTLGEAEFSVAAGDGLRVLEDVEYEQRMDDDRVANPHGEHAVEVFRLGDLDPGPPW